MATIASDAHPSFWVCDGCGKTSPWLPGWQRMGTQEEYDLLGPDGIVVSCGEEKCRVVAEAFYQDTRYMREKAVHGLKQKKGMLEAKVLDTRTEKALREYLSERSLN